MSEVRPARWPWVASGGFFSLAIVGMIGVAVNGESLAGQIPYVIAFTLFGIVGALLLSRLPGNRVGGLLLFGAAVTAGSFAAGELMTYLVRGATRMARPWWRWGSCRRSGGWLASSR